MQSLRNAPSLRTDCALGLEPENRGWRKGGGDASSPNGAGDASSPNGAGDAPGHVFNPNSEVGRRVAATPRRSKGLATPSSPVAAAMIRWSEPCDTGVAITPRRRGVAATLGWPLRNSGSNELWLNPSRSVWTAPASAALAGGRPPRWNGCVRAPSGAQATAVQTLRVGLASETARSVWTARGLPPLSCACDQQISGSRP